MLPLILFAILSVTGYGNINYNMTDNGTALGAILDQGTNTLEIDISAPHNGLLALEIPRTMLDTNSTFLVLNDGNITSYNISATKTTNNVIIPYIQNDERITVTGTHSAPEFPIAIAFMGVIFSMAILLRLNRN